MGDNDGVEIRPASIRLFFVWDGERHKETLKVGGKPMPPTKGNIEHARRVAVKIRKAISLGTFAMADFFPDSKRAGAKSADKATFAEQCELYLATKGRLSKNSRNQYRNALEVWKALLGADKPIARMTHGFVAGKVGETAWASAKLLNNYLIPLRGVFALAGRDLKLDDNPIDGIENSKHQAPTPDPLTLAEANAIMADMRRNYDPRVLAYFVFAFATGCRPEELIALRWSDIDWNHRTVLVQRARTAGELKAVKMYQVRHVDLIPEAIEALQAMKPFSFMLGVEVEVFQNPVTGKPWHDERSQRDHYWAPALRRLGIRHRRAYQTRHTYATIALMGEVNPAYVSRQMGHKNAKMLFDIYSKWIDGADQGRQRAKLAAARAPALAELAAKAAGDD